jgi:hypothetical protein
VRRRPTIWISLPLYSPGDQYGQPAPGGGAAAAASEEGGAATGNYRRIFTEEQYRMLEQVG